MLPACDDAYCSRALASTLPAAPASFAQVYPQVVRRERVPVTTVVWNLGGGYLAAAASARDLNHGRAIGRKHAPATIISNDDADFAPISRSLDRTPNLSAET